MITVPEATATAGALRRLSDDGGSAPMDDPSRGRIASAGLAGRVRGRVAGATTGPSVLRAAIGSGEDHGGLFAGDRFTAPAAAGTGRQRPPRASTGAKDPAYRDTRSREEPVALGTGDTMPATAPTAAGHGGIRGDTVTGGHARARVGPAAVARSGTSYHEAVAQPENGGVTPSGAARREPPGAVTKSSHTKGVDAE